MGKFSKDKGARGEREVKDMLLGLIEILISNMPHLTEDTKTQMRLCIQRNQNQTAVGGHDLNGVFGLSVEVKRVEVPNVNAWWAQCKSQAARNNEVPVLLYRGNGHSWTCMTMGHIATPEGTMLSIPITISESDFKAWFYQWVYYKVIRGEMPRL